MKFYNENTDFWVERHVGNIVSNDEHFHDRYEFYYLEEGKAEYLINDKIYTLHKGDVVAIPPNTLHKTVYSEKGERKRILFYLKRDFLDSIHGCDALLPPMPLFYHATKEARITAIFGELLNEFQKEGALLYLQILIAELLILLCRTENDAPSLPQGREATGVIGDILTYIAANFAQDITLYALSERFYMNASYLSRLFKARTGFTFCSYLNQYRIKEANRLLTETTQPITEIALACGFNSSGNFCKCYKKIMGTSPLVYRKRMQKNASFS